MQVVLNGGSEGNTPPASHLTASTGTEARAAAAAGGVRGGEGGGSGDTDDTATARAVVAEEGTGQQQPATDHAHPYSPGLLPRSGQSVQPVQGQDLHRQLRRLEQMLQWPTHLTNTQDGEQQQQQDQGGGVGVGVRDGFGGQQGPEWGHGDTEEARAGDAGAGAAVDVAAVERQGSSTADVEGAAWWPAAPSGAVAAATSPAHDAAGVGGDGDQAAGATRAETASPVPGHGAGGLSYAELPPAPTPTRASPFATAAAAAAAPQSSGGTQRPALEPTSPTARRRSSATAASRRPSATRKPPFAVSPAPPDRNTSSDSGGGAAPGPSRPPSAAAARRYQPPPAAAASGAATAGAGGSASPDLHPDWLLVLTSDPRFFQPCPGPACAAVHPGSRDALMTFLDLADPHAPGVCTYCRQERLEAGHRCGGGGPGVLG